MANIFHYFRLNSLLLSMLLLAVPIIGESKVQNEDYENLYNKVECLNNYFRHIRTSKEALNILIQLKFDVEEATKTYVMLPAHLMGLSEHFKKNAINLSKKQIDLLENIILKKTEYKRKIGKASLLYMGNLYTGYVDMPFEIMSIESDMKKIPQDIIIGVSLSLCGMILKSLPDETFEMVGFSMLTYGTQITYQGFNTN